MVRSFLIFVLVGNLISVAQLANAASVSLDSQADKLLETGECNALSEYLEASFSEQWLGDNLKVALAICYRKAAQKAYKKRMFEEAVALYESALQYDETDGSLYLELGESRFQLSDYPNAKNAYLEALKLLPNNLVALKQLGQLSYLTGNKEDARFYWQQGLDVANKDPLLRQSIEKLDREQSVTGSAVNEADYQFAISFDQGMDRQLYELVWSTLRDARYEIGTRLNAWPERKISVVLLTRSDFSRATEAPMWVGGLYEGQIKVPVSGYTPDVLKKVLYHEYVHALIYDMMANRCPWWLNEGLAQYFSDDAEEKDRKKITASEYLRLAKNIDLAGLPGELGKSSNGIGLSYALALSATDFLAERFTITAVRNILHDMRGGLLFREALAGNTAYSYDEFVRMWLADQ